MPHGNNGIQINNHAQMMEIGERTERDYLQFIPQSEELYRNYGAGFINRNLSEAQRNAQKNNTGSALFGTDQ